jgi:hypothetical protein
LKFEIACLLSRIAEENLHSSFLILISEIVIFYCHHSICSLSFLSFPAQLDQFIFVFLVLQFELIIEEI